MKYATAGDPMSDLKWTRKTTQKIADALDAIDIKVSKTTVGKILKNLGFSLETNIKRISNGGKELTKKERKDSNIQFEYISEMRQQFNKIKTDSNGFCGALNTYPQDTVAMQKVVPKIQ